MNRWAALALLLAVAGALALRIPHLDARPLHNDEGVNAVKVAALWEHGDYKYDPHEFHGPLLYYAALPYLWLSPAKSAADLDATRLRLVTIAFGVGLILLLFLVADALGGYATAVAAVLIAVSPAMVFYSRYFIHEIPLIFFTLLTIAAGWRYWKSHKARWAAVGGASVGFMYATKETFVLTLAAMAGAAIATTLWNRWWTRQGIAAGAPAASAVIPPDGRIPWRRFGSRNHILIALGSALLVWLVLFTSFFTNWAGLGDSIRTYLPWLNRAGGNSPHIHPWHFYFDRLLGFTATAKSLHLSERWIAVLALIGAARAFCNDRNAMASPAFGRFLVFYTALAAGVYSVISYKTPWCLLNFWIGFLLLAGVGAIALVKLSSQWYWRGMMALAVGLGIISLARQSVVASQTYAADRRNPYNYAQTPETLLDLVKCVDDVARVAPDGYGTMIKIIAPDSYGPLPWYLRRFTQSGWWEQLPEDPIAPIVIASSKVTSQLDAKLSATHVMAGLYSLHPGANIQLYVENALWEKSTAQPPKSQQ